MTVSELAKSKAAAAIAIALTGAGVALYTGTADTQCIRALAEGPSAMVGLPEVAAVAIDAPPGGLVVVAVEVPFEPSELSIEEQVSAALPAGVTPIGGSARIVDCATMARADREMTLRDPAEVQGLTCMAGRVRMDTSDIGDGSRWREWAGVHVCCGPRCECLDAPCVDVPRQHNAGSGSWRELVCHRRPGLCG